MIFLKHVIFLLCRNFQFSKMAIPICICTNSVQWCLAPYPHGHFLSFIFLITILISHWFLIFTSLMWDVMHVFMCVSMYVFFQEMPTYVPCPVFLLTLWWCMCLCVFLCVCTYMSICMHSWLHVCHGVPVEVRRQLLGDCFLLLWYRVSLGCFWSAVYFRQAIP